MTQILPLLEQEGNRRLMSEWIRQRTEYEIVGVETEGGNPLSVDFDLCIVDGQALSDNRETLKTYRDEMEPEFVPVLLLVPHEYANHLTEDVWTVVDDIIWTSGGAQFDSLDTFELLGRMKSLLRAREMSMTLIDNQERLKVLHRVLRHNLRNSLNVIMGTAQLIDDPEKNEQVQRIVETTRRLLHHADNARSIDEILDDPDGKEIDLSSEIDRIVESYRSEYPNADITVTNDEPMTIKAIDGFTQAIDELIENAIRHNPDDSRAIRISAESDGDTGTISVEDNGPPIPEPDSAVLESGLKETSLKHGSGLGLWLVAWVVRRSNGTVSHDRESDGNRITIEVPIAK